MTVTTSNYESLSNQADKAAANYLDSAIHLLNTHFGNGYAKENPVLVGQLVYAMATDFQSMALAKTMTDLSEKLAYIIAEN